MQRALPLSGALALLALAFTACGRRAAVDPRHISLGEEVVLSAHLVPGKITVFDFTSKYCPPCQAYNQPLALLQAQRADIAVIKVDINRPGVRGIDWDSPVVRQYQLRSIPHFKVYGPDGRLIAEDKLVVGPDGNLVSRDPAARLMVDRWINALK